MRYSIQPNFHCEIKNDDLVGFARSLRANAIASLFTRKVQKVFLTGIFDAGFCAGHDFALSARPPRIESITQPVIHDNVSRSTLARSVCVVARYGKFVAVVGAWTARSKLVASVCGVVILRQILAAAARF